MIAKVKGMNDLVYPESEKLNKVIEKIRFLFKLYNAREIVTPLLEHSEVFHREKENSDMVIKETYDFMDRGNRKLTIRPEGTAGVARAYLENKLYLDDDIVKLFYFGTFYRYERPQKGRLREFRQFGIEVFNSDSYLIDLEVIELVSRIYNSFGLKTRIRLNSLGNETSILNYKSKIKEYFNLYKESLCPDCLNRLENNPLRILDCKVDCHKDFFKNAPSTLKYLDLDSKKRFEELLKLLDKLEIPYLVDDKLVRGLDYYSETVFEIDILSDNNDAIKTLGGGGRYNNLTKELGGENTSCFGFAGGIERLINALDETNYDYKLSDSPKFYIITFDKEFEDYGLSILKEIRDKNIAAEFSYKDRSIKSKVKKGITLNSKYLIIIGKNEFDNQTLILKDTVTSTQEELSYSSFKEFLENMEK